MSYTGKEFSSLVPEGWVERKPGEFSRGNPDTDPTALIQQGISGITLEMAISLLPSQLGLETFPASVGGIRNADLAWELYLVEREEPNVGKVMADVALAEADGRVYIVLLVAKHDEYKDLHYEVFLRVVDALTPLAPDAGEKRADASQKATQHTRAEVLLVTGERLENDASDVVAHLLQTELGLTTAFIDLDALGEADYAGVKLIYFPGGDCASSRLSEKASRRVREAVAAGTGYIGTCCGAFLGAEATTAASHFRLQGDSFGIFPGLAEWGGGEGFWPFHIDVSHPIIKNPSVAQQNTHSLLLAAVEWCTGVSEPASDQAPVIVADIPGDGLADRFFVCSAEGSHDPHGYPIGFTWDFGDGSPKQYRPAAIHVYEKPGAYTVTLTATTGTRHTTKSTEVRIREP